ncbi:MAG: hypothetical protein OXI43_18875 [Candidatus Poribacteria bacterium]|nr:hypothetical protein [Candidatus Poribacteria bacterium]
MTKKMYLGIAALIVFMIAAGGFIYWQVSTVQQMKKQTALFEKMLEKEEKPVAANEPPPAAPGKKWVPHGDHFHEVPIDAPDVWQGEPHEPVAQTYDGPLTYHEELLKTDPVQALRLQAEERGHWMTKWIPPFPADDHEASELARVVYLLIYHEHVGDYPEISPERETALKRKWNLIKEYDTRYPIESDDVKVRARWWDLTKLTWAMMPYRLFDDEQISEYPSEFTQK